MSVVCHRIDPSAQALVGEVHAAQPVLEASISPCFKFCLGLRCIRAIALWDSSMASLVFAIRGSHSNLQRARSVSANVAVQSFGEIGDREHTVGVIFATAPGFWHSVTMRTPSRGESIEAKALRIG